MESLSKLADFIDRMRAQYRQIQSSFDSKIRFRIVDEKKDRKTKEKIFTIQMIGKSLCFKMPAHKLLQDPEFINGFSEKDAQTILQTNRSKPTLTVVQPSIPQYPFRILAKNLPQGTTEEPSYLIEHTNPNGLQEKVIISHSLLLQFKEDIPKFSPQDIFEIAYTAGQLGVGNLLIEA